MGAITTTTTTQVVEAPKMSSVPDVKTMRDAIPAKCFERSLVRSMSYVVRDLIAVSALCYSGVLLSRLDAPWVVTVPLWALYSFVQGCFFTGLWILAHECGHDSFSPYLNVNATVGWFLHSMLMVPFFSWKFSHSRHHRYANHMEKDTVFVPCRKEELEAKLEKKPGLGQKLMDHTAADTPIVSLGALIFHQVFGWPAYVLLNAGAGVNSLIKSNRKESHKWKQSHLDPTAHTFTDAEQPFVLLSNIGLIAVMTSLYFASKSLGVGTTFLLYGLPYLWMNHWIVAITYLHHTHPDAQHYEAENWTYAKGALSTVDREFGFIGRHIFHGIIEYHVVHHIFPRIPFYHCEEATWAIAPMLGDKYIEQRTNFFADLWTAFTECKFVEEGTGATKGGLVWGKSKKTQ
ncbi:fatty acid desaturase-domain-containing protein [Paraphoma chrysanthemicola]|uniref:Fatty acid desaturase-domain-containing protein n=1 Tax=Paraphoma chrysanthemicola TaxID=798071 RepID=A0A8K0RHP6_9PLEO|nr:fatty acid desaturase-domain-containing protein [Paraphoma chrysanthemicola]